MEEANKTENKKLIQFLLENGGGLHWSEKPRWNASDVKIYSGGCVMQENNQCTMKRKIEDRWDNEKWRNNIKWGDEKLWAFSFGSNKTKIFFVIIMFFQNKNHN